MIRTGFTGGLLDRADRLRHDVEALAAAMADPRARLLRLDGFDPTGIAEGRLGWTGLDASVADTELVLLGLDEGAPCFAALPSAGHGPATRSPELMAALDSLVPGEAATYAAARSVLDWHARHGFCANCGHATGLFRAGWGRKCPHCATEHFPRVDPVVIMIAEHDGHALVGRQPTWPAGRYSALAGFLEPGESVEEAVAREIAEEAGVQVTEVRYLASQPWPFPSQLMIACTARALDRTLTIDEHELEDAIWVSRDEVRAALASEEGARFSPPPRYAIAHTLLSEWVAAG